MDLEVSPGAHDHPSGKSCTLKGRGRDVRMRTANPGSHLPGCRMSGHSSLTSHVQWEGKLNRSHEYRVFSVGLQRVPLVPRWYKRLQGRPSINIINQEVVTPAFSRFNIALGQMFSS